MIAQSNVTHMLVGKDLDVALITDTRDDLEVGQIGVFKVGSTTATGANALSAGDRYSIVLKKIDGNLLETPVLTFGSETAKNAKLYAAPVQQSAVIGYNGTSGSIDVSNSTNYVMHLFWKDSSKFFGGHGQPVKFGAYYSSSAATQGEIAAGLVENLIKNFSRENPKLLKVELLSAEAGDALGTSVDTITLKNGSKYFTADDIDDATTNAALAVGNYLRVGTATTSPLYEITAIDTTNNIGTLAVPYQGDDYSAEDTAFEQVTAADFAAAAAGVKLTALALTDEFIPGVIRYDVTSFQVELKEEFGSTTYTASTAASRGSGSYWEIAQNEWFLKGNRGETYRVASYPITNSLQAISGKTYDQITVEYAQNNSKTIDRNVAAFGSILIATEDASVGAIHANLKTILGIS